MLAPAAVIVSRVAAAQSVRGSCQSTTVAAATTIRNARKSQATLSFSSIVKKHVDEVIISASTSSNAADNLQDDDVLQQELATLIAPYYRKQQPLVVRNIVKDVPATKLWSKWEHWQRKIDEHNDDPLVAVEMGGPYNSAAAGKSERAEIPLSAYLQFLQLFETRHGSTGSLENFHSSITASRDGSSSSNESVPPNEEIVYMAQNDLLEFLYPEIMIPSFCNNSDDEIDNETSKGATTSEDTNDQEHASTTPTTKVGHGRLYSVMMWLGPRGCVSPLHFDPLDNCLLQHVGRKRVLLFAPNHNNDYDNHETIPWHYAGYDGQQSNTSPIDPEILDDANSATIQEYQNKYPLFWNSAPPRLECVVEPGDLLYIPSKWWHHVRSIDTSASVNVWWR